MVNTLGPLIATLYTTISSLEEAENIAQEAVKGKYAACVNIIPNIKSIYEWEGKIEHTTEYIMLFKTLASNLELLEEWLLGKHPYQTPAILKGVAGTSIDFLKYISNQIGNIKHDQCK